MQLHIKEKEKDKDEEDDLSYISPLSLASKTPPFCVRSPPLHSKSPTLYGHTSSPQKRSNEGFNYKKQLPCIHRNITIIFIEISKSQHTHIEDIYKKNIITNNRALNSSSVFHSYSFDLPMPNEKNFLNFPESTCKKINLGIKCAAYTVPFVPKEYTQKYFFDMAQKSLSYSQPQNLIIRQNDIINTTPFRISGGTQIIPSNYRDELYVYVDNNGKFLASSGDNRPLISSQSFEVGKSYFCLCLPNLSPFMVVGVNKILNEFNLINNYIHNMHQ